MQSEIVKRKRFTSREIGFIYETIACNYLIKSGFEVIKKNLFTRFGEIDILAKKEENFYIFEVKGGKNFEEIYERFSKTKMLKLNKLAQYICRKENLESIYVDGIIICAKEGTIMIRHIKNIL